MKTRDEIEDLKRQWREDQGWELAESEGFEEHAAELGAYQAQVEAEQRAKATAEHREAVVRMIKPAIDLFAVTNVSALVAHGAGSGLSRAGLDILLHAVAEMVLPLQRQIGRQREDIEAMQTRHEDELDALRAEIRKGR